MSRNMGFDFGLELPNLCVKRKFRWLFKIPNVSAQGVNALPPEKGARPSLSFKELEIQHVNETFYIPSKPEWKTVNLRLYDIVKQVNPVYNWFKTIYNPCTGKWNPVTTSNFKQIATVDMLNGCGDVVETWVYENIWPQAIDFGELDMGDASYTTIDLTLRYDRAYLAGEC